MGKLQFDDSVPVTPERALSTGRSLFRHAGAPDDIADQVAAHLVEAEQCGVASHGVMRILQYTREMLDGVVVPDARPQIQEEGGRIRVDALGGMGIPAMAEAYQQAVTRAQAAGLAAISLSGAGHTGRLGAFGEAAARQGCLTITIGGGNRDNWRMVAPFGGRDAVLPTNPYCLAIPGGDRGPVVVDIATSQGAGGWIYAARAAGVELPDGVIIDRDGAPTRDPQAYFEGGAILPKGGPLGYGLALMAEMICDAMLGPVERGEVNWLILALDCGRYREPHAMQQAAERILEEIRGARPMPGHGAVLVPGERERDAWSRAQGKDLLLPRKTWAAIEDMERTLLGPRGGVSRC